MKTAAIAIGLLVSAWWAWPAPVVFVGDSNTAGAIADVDYVDRLGGLRAGCGGSAVRSFLEPRRLFQEPACWSFGAFELVEQHLETEPRPRVAHVLLGSNDSGGHVTGYEFDPVVWGDRLRTLAGRLRLEGFRRVVVSVPPLWCDEGWLPFVTEDQAAERNRWIGFYALRIEELAEELWWVELGVDLREMPREHFVDCVHFGDDGHAWLAERLGPLLAPRWGHRRP